MISPPDSRPWPPTKPARRPFVGRQAYLDYFMVTLHALQAGRAAVTFLQGEAGMGKTRLLEEIHRLAQQQGFIVYASRCYEDIHVPYLPFVEALRPLALQPMTAEPESASALVSQWLQGHLSLPTLGEPDGSARAEQERFRMFLALSQVMLGLAQQRPTLVLLDDFHWADAPSLDLLLYLVSRMAERAAHNALPLGIIVTHRPIEPAQRLARLLARCQRESLCQSLELRSVDEVELAAMLRTFGVERPSPALLHTFMESTAGSPLFIKALYDYLVQRQVLRDVQGQMVTTVTTVDLRLPGTVTEMFLTRTAQLHPASLDCLTTAALLSDVFDVQILQAVSGIGDDVLLSYLDEALQHDFLLSEGQTFQFVHPLLRHALVHHTSVAQRQRRHWHIAQTLLGLYGPRLDDRRCLEVASHLIQAGSLASAEAVIRYVRRAADYAFALCDWPYAAQAYTMVLAAAVSGDSLTVAARAELAYLAGTAYARDGDGERSDRYLEQAVAGYRTAEQLPGVVQALIAKTLRVASVAYGVMIETKPLEALLEEVGDTDLSLRGRIATALSEVYWAGLQQPQAEAMAQQGVALGQALGDWPLCARASFNLSLAYAQRLQLSAALTACQQAREYAQQANDAFLEGWPLQRQGAYLLMLGRFEEARTVASEARELVTTTTNWRHYSLTSSAQTAMALCIGAFETTERYAEETMALVSRYGLPFGGAFALLSLACAHALRGAWNAAEAALATLLEPGRVFAQPNAVYTTLVQLYRQLIQTYAPPGTLTAVITPSWREVPVPTACDVNTLSLCCILVELSVAHADAARAEQLSRVLTPLLDEGILFAREWSFLLPRLVGLTAMLQQRWDTAEHHFQTAIATATELDAKPERARTYLDYAQMLVTRGEGHDYTRALELLSKGHLLCQSLGMAPFVQRADTLSKALQERLSPLQTPVSEPSLSLSQYELDLLTDMSQDDTSMLR